MISLDLLRQDPDAYKRAATYKNREVNIDRILELDAEIKTREAHIQELRTQRNMLAERGKTDLTTSRTEGKEIKEKLKHTEDELQKLKQEIRNLLSFVPNIPLPEVPVGKDETENVEVRRVGEPPVWDFTPQDHMTLGKRLDIVDTERGSKVSGYRGYFLKNQGAILQNALLLYVMQKLAGKGYTPVVAPAIVKGFTLYGTGQFPWGEREVYKLNDEDAYLAGTAEQPVTSYYADEVLQADDLPKKFVACSPCFRREAGSYGKDTKGLYRLHEFFKIEQVVFCESSLDTARLIHEELQSNCEEILHDLELSYRVLLMCTGDMGEPQMKKYDTEAWMPSRNAYGETMSNSIMGDFQTRRLNIRYKTKEGRTEYCYSLNNTAVATPRILIALLENHQRPDGSVSIPKKLRPLCGFDHIPAR